MHGLTENDLKIIRQALAQYDCIDHAKIFGSRAMGNFKRGSDVDIALFGNIDFDTLGKINYLLNEESPLPYFFDVLVYDQIENDMLKKHIDEFGLKL